MNEQLANMVPSQHFGAQLGPTADATSPNIGGQRVVGGQSHNNRAPLSNSRPSSTSPASQQYSSSGQLAQQYLNIEFQHAHQHASQHYSNRNPGQGSSNAVSLKSSISGAGSLDPGGALKSGLIDQDLFLQMQQQYEQKIRSLQSELQALKSQLNNKNRKSLKNPTSQNQCGNAGGNGQHIVETYCEQILPKEFSCKNCSYKTKSEASLIIHQTNHLVMQRYLHLPTTVFSADIKSTGNGSSTSSGASSLFLYPCGECNGKYSHNDLYLHIYQHHTIENPFHCEECNLFFMHFEFLDDHQRNDHNNKKSWSIMSPAFKKYRFNTNSSGTGSNNINPHLTYYSVIKCSKPFSSFVPTVQGARASAQAAQQESWNQHLNSGSHTYFPPKRGRGRVSGHRITNPSQPQAESSLQNLSIVHNKSGESSIESPAVSVFKCYYDECYFQADSKERLEFHLFAHRNSRFKCPHCPYVSNVLSDIKRHCVKGQKHTQAMFCCPNCTFQCNCDKTFKDHIRNVHFGRMVDELTLQAFVEDMFRNTGNSPQNNNNQPPASANYASSQMISNIKIESQDHASHNQIQATQATQQAR